MYRFLLLILLSTSYVFSQDITSGRISGNFQVDAQYYTKDSVIGAANPPSEKILSNSFLNLIYNIGDFEIGLRYEAYLNPIQGFDTRYQGQGIFYRYITYTSDLIDITAGGFYEQFGSGLIFRAYEERQIGLDNMIDGARFKFRPKYGITFTGLIGKQRSFWNYGKGIVRAGDLSISVDDLFGHIISGAAIELGGSAVSRYQSDESSLYRLPENVLAYSTRLNVSGESFNASAEFGYKYNDPNAMNKYRYNPAEGLIFENYNPGKGLLLTGSYFTEGLGVSLNFHSIDNMDYRNDRSAQGTNLFINFIPPITKQHLYKLALTYPYATQLNSEIGIQSEITYTIPKGSMLGGEFGTQIALNGSIISSLDSNHTLMDTTEKIFKYSSNMFKPGDRLFYRDINLDITKRWSEDFKTDLMFISIVSDRDVLENEGVGKFGKVNANIAAIDILYKITSKISLRTEFQHLWFKQDSVYKDPDYTYGNWALGLVELTFAPNFYLTVWDEFNYFKTDMRDTSYNLTEISRTLHYPSISFAYLEHATRVSLTYGRVVGGLLCVGGICRPVKPSNGFSLSVTSSF